MLQLRKISSMLIAMMAVSPIYACKIAIVIDDFGYHPVQENQVLKMPAAISVAVLPSARQSHEIATKAHQHGHEVLIHMPMAPLSKQPLEKDTLQSNMSSKEIARIIHEAATAVPFAVGLNNHMGSAMTSSLSGMRKVMQVLDHYNFYFLDSMTIGNSQSIHAAIGTRVKVIKRQIFLDNMLNEAYIHQQLNRTIRIAQRDGSAIAIGHPHSTTVRVLQQILPTLPTNISLVPPSKLLNEPQRYNCCLLRLKNKIKSKNLSHDLRVSKVKVSPISAMRALEMLRERISNSMLIQDLEKDLRPN